MTERRDIICRPTRHAFKLAASRAVVGIGQEKWNLDTEMRSCEIGSSGQRFRRRQRDLDSRMEDYFDTIDWSSRSDVRRIIPLFERLIVLMSKVPESGHYIEWIRFGLEDDGWHINRQGKIVEPRAGQKLLRSE